MRGARTGRRGAKADQERVCRARALKEDNVRDRHLRFVDVVLLFHDRHYLPKGFGLIQFFENVFVWLPLRASLLVTGHHATLIDTGTPEKMGKVKDLALNGCRRGKGFKWEERFQPCGGLARSLYESLCAQDQDKLK